MLSLEAFAILDLVTEDSFGLWEIASDFVERYNDRTASEATRLAQATALDLLKEGLVSLWSQTDVGAEERAIPSTEAKTALSEASNWDWPGASGIMFRLLATEAGKRAYHSQSREGA